MKNRTLTSATENQPDQKPSLQFCDILQSLLVSTKPYLRKSNCFFADGLEALRSAYGKLINNHIELKDMAIKYEKSRGEFSVPAELHERLDNAKHDIEEKEQELEHLHAVFSKKQSTLEKKEQAILEQIAELQQEQKYEVQKNRQARNAKFMDLQKEKTSLMERDQELKDEMKHKQFFKKLKMRKQRKEVREKLKGNETLIEKLKTEVIEDKDSSAVAVIEKELIAVRQQIDNYRDNYFERSKVQQAQISAAKSRLEMSYVRIKQAKAKWDASLSKELYLAFKDLTKTVHAFLEAINELKNGKTMKKKTLNKLEGLKAQVLSEGGRLMELFNVFWYSSATPEHALFSEASGHLSKSSAFSTQEVGHKYANFFQDKDSVSSSSPVSSSASLTRVEFSSFKK